jgi:hypothetical protein
MVSGRHIELVRVYKPTVQHNWGGSTKLRDFPNPNAVNSGEPAPSCETIKMGALRLVRIPLSFKPNTQRAKNTEMMTATYLPSNNVISVVRDIYIYTYNYI